MGREITAQVRWQGAEGEAKVLLESTELILRGELKAKLARSAIERAKATADGLSLSINGEPLHVTMNVAEAARWVKAIETPPPSLAAKLGVGPDRPVFAVGALDDPALAEALCGATTASPEQASQLLVVIENPAQLESALALARTHPSLALWCVYPKGKAADPGDAEIRVAFREAGWMDNKTSAVSDRLTATRYARKR